MSTQTDADVAAHRRATGKFYEDQDPALLSPDEVRRLVHELRVRQDELEMQNEELRRGQVDLQRAERILTEAESMAHVGAWWWDLRTDERYFSEELLRIFRLSPGDPAAIRAAIWKAVHPDDYDGLAQAYTGALAGGDVLDQTYRIITPSGETRVVRGRADVVPDLAGELVWIYGMVQDITEQEQIKQAIREHAAELAAAVTERTLELRTERDRMQAILETMRDAVAVTDLAGCVLYANPASESLTGYAPAELAGKPLWRLWSSEAPADPWLEVQATLDSGGTWHGEIVGRRKTGARYVAALVATPVSDPIAPGVRAGGVWMLTDISALREAEQLKNRFIADISHGLRTPVAIIEMSVDNLVTGYDRLGESQRTELLQDMRDQAHLLGQLVNGILKLPQLDEGVQRASWSRVDLGRLVRGEVDKLRPAARRRAQHLTARAGTGVDVYGNEMDLRDVVANLLDNAVKYTPQGGHIVCTCEMRLPADVVVPPSVVARPESWAVVEVADDGPGITAEHLPHVLDRFYRVQPEGEIAGLGLGLSIANEVVQAHGGWLEVHAAVGKGSTFSACLPCLP